MTSIRQWHQNWTVDLCGIDGLHVWAKDQHDFGICFQELCFQIPLLCLLAVFSAYFWGRSRPVTHPVQMGIMQERTLKFRSFLVFLLTIVPLIKIYINLSSGTTNILIISYFLGVIQGITWFCHFWYTIALRKYLGRNPRGPVTICVIWTGLLVLSIVSLRSHYLRYAYGPKPDYSIYLSYQFSLVNVVLLSLYLFTLLPGPGAGQILQVPDETQPLLTWHQFTDDLDPNYLGIAMENSNWLSKLLFYWVNPLMDKEQLKETEDLFDLPFDLDSDRLWAFLDKALIGNIDLVHGPIQGRHNVSLFLALHKCFWRQFYGIGILRLIADLASFSGPILLNRLIDFIENVHTTHYGYLYAAGLVAVTIIAAFSDSHFNFQMSVLGLKMRAALVATIYRKTLSVRKTDLSSEFSIGEIVNFMSIDTDRIVNSCPSFHSLWSIPFQLSVTLYLLYQQVGVAFIAGLIFSILLIPINKLIANQIAKLSTKMMSAKDDRIKILTEILRGMNVIKLYVWERYFLRMVTRLREQELKYLKGRKYLDALCVYFWATTPVIISILTFGTYVLMGHELNAATVFTGIALLNMLISPLNAFPWVLNGLTEAWVSLKRLQKLLNVNSTTLEEIYDFQLDPNQQSIILDNVNLYNLRDISLTIKKGEFIGITGAIGSGKSTLLNAILGEFTRNCGKLGVNSPEDGFGYVAQQPWLQNGTIRENIIFGNNVFDETHYRTVLNACALTEDLEQLPAGDLTLCGESGTNLSGGQRARVALARAIYQNKQIYLLDDVLAACDQNVARHIFQHCIMGVLQYKTRLFCTHEMRYLTHTDRILYLENGRIKRTGKPSEIMHLFVPDTGVEKQIQLESKSDLRPDEFSPSGGVNFIVYVTYLRAVGYWLCLGVLTAICAMQFTRNLSDWWLAAWVSNPMPTTKFYLEIYAAFVVVNTFFTLCRAFLFAYGGIVAASKLHKLLQRSVIWAKMTFFHSTPIGRIVNRFSSDTYTIDDSLPFIFNILLAQFFGLLGTVAVTVYGLPWICLVLVPLVPVYHWLQYHYRTTSRELKRLSSVTLSPIYTHFNESLQGQVTIRAHRVEGRFIADNQRHLETNLRAQFAANAAARWLALRLQLIAVAMVTGVSFIAVIQHQYDTVNAGYIGLALSYCLSVSGALSGVVNSFTETEREFIAVERVTQYIRDIPIEENITTGYDPPFGWPNMGVITFDNVTFRYRDDLEPVLHQITFQSRSAEKIGIVGRTGAGKSSLFQALFQLCGRGLVTGQITIDFVDIHVMALESIRTRIFCIPQEPFIFSGTIRNNLDPLNEYQEWELWTALREVNLYDFVTELGGLDTYLDGEELQFSSGQKQLICLARAVLHKAKVISRKENVLCIDEATANVDKKTERHIQRTIKRIFRNSTVLTIAHRLETIMDSDRILVLDHGRIVEFNTPSNLTVDPSSYFHELLSTNNT